MQTRTHITLVIAALLSAWATRGYATGINITMTQVSTCETFTGTYPYDMTFEIHGQLTDGASAGLAGFCFDLRAMIGAVPYSLASAVVLPPSDGTMDAFAESPGVTSVAGYGGTLTDGRLIQIGGAQDTTNASGQSNTVTLGVAESDQVLAIVSVTLAQAPPTGATYTFIGEDVRGNVILDGQSGPVYDVVGFDPAPGGATLSWAVGACCHAGACTDGMSVAACTALSDYVCDVDALRDGTGGWGNCGANGGNCCYGDADGNGTVNAGDAGFISANLGQTANHLRCLFDMDGNGLINVGDRGFVFANIGQCTALPDFQNGSGMNHGVSDRRFPGRWQSPCSTCEQTTCP